MRSRQLRDGSHIGRANDGLPTCKNGLDRVGNTLVAKAPGALDAARIDLRNLPFVAHLPYRDVFKAYAAHEIGYAKQQATRPQTLAYALADSPVGQAAWIYEKLKGWMDPAQEPEDVFGLDAMLDNIMLYWLGNAGGSSARLYWESLDQASLSRPITLPVAVSLFPHDVTYAPRHWAERLMRNITSWNEVEAGGHLAAFEQPGILVREVRAAFRGYRSAAAAV